MTTVTPRSVAGQDRHGAKRIPAPPAPDPQYANGYADGFASGVDVGRGRTENEYEAAWSQAVAPIKAVLAQPTQAELRRRRGDSERVQPSDPPRPVTTVWTPEQTEAEIEFWAAAYRDDSNNFTERLTMVDAYGGTPLSGDQATQRSPGWTPPEGMPNLLPLSRAVKPNLCPVPTGSIPLWRSMLAALVGPGGSGKSLLAARAMLGALRNGEAVMVLDGEMGVWPWRERLADLGATEDELARVFHTPMGAEVADVDVLLHAIELLGVVLVVWDSALAMLCTDGIDSENDNVAVMDTYQRISNVVKHAEIAGLIVDHTAKAGTTLGPRGASAKFNHLDLAYGVMPGTGPRDKAQPWTVTLSVEKDRHSVLSGSRGFEVTFDGGALPNTVTVTGAVDVLRAPRKPESPSPEERVAALARRIAALDPVPTSANKAFAALGGNRREVLAAYRLHEEQTTAGTGTTSTNPVLSTTGTTASEGGTGTPPLKRAGTGYHPERAPEGQDHEQHAGTSSAVSAIPPRPIREEPPMPVVSPAQTDDTDAETETEMILVSQVPAGPMDETELIYQLVRENCEIGEPVTTDEVRQRLAGCGWVSLWERDRYVEKLIALRDAGRIGFVPRTTYWAPTEELAS